MIRGPTEMKKKKQKKNIYWSYVRRSFGISGFQSMQRDSELLSNNTANLNKVSKKITETRTKTSRAGERTVYF